VVLTLASVAVLATGCTGSSGGGQDDRAVAPDGGRGAASTPAPDPHTADPDPRHLRVGDCFTTGPATLPGGVLNAGSTVRIVPCRQPHDAEAFGRITDVARPYPGPTEVRDDAVRYCGNLVAAYAMDSWAFSAAANPTREFLPGQAAWDAGDRGGICFFVPHGGPVTTSLRRDRQTLTADQYAYLDASDRVESAISVDPYSTDPAVNHDARYDDLSRWAGGVAESLVIEQQLLKSHRWPARAQGPVNALLQVLAAEAPLWHDASDAPNLAGVKAQAAAAGRVDSTAQQKAVRQALGLAAVRAAAAVPGTRTGTGTGTGTAGG
jgi:hypothetical protein